MERDGEHVCVLQLTLDVVVQAYQGTLILAVVQGLFPF